MPGRGDASSHAVVRCDRRGARGKACRDAVGRARLCARRVGRDAHVFNAACNARRVWHALAFANGLLCQDPAAVLEKRRRRHCHIFGARVRVLRRLLRRGFALHRKRSNGVLVVPRQCVALAARCAAHCRVSRDARCLRGVSPCPRLQSAAALVVPARPRRRVHVALPPRGATQAHGSASASLVRTICARSIGRVGGHSIRAPGDCVFDVVVRVSARSRCKYASVSRGHFCCAR